MNPLYRLLVTVARGVPASPNWSGAARGRRTAADRWVAWARRAGLPDRVLWLHAASVGEALAAEPVLRRIRASVGPVGIVHTHTSPSVTGWAADGGRPWEADRTDFAPEETRASLERVFDALRPSVLVFSRGDLWPGLVDTAARRGVPIAVVGGIVSPGSLRLAPPLRPFFRSLGRRVAYLGAASAGDARRWERLGVPASVIEVIGDPRDDEIARRTTDLTRLRPLEAWSRGKQVLVAGSTHRGEHRLVVSAFATIARRRRDARLLVAPHDLSADMVGRLLAESRRAGLRAGAWAEGGVAPGTEVLILARRGLLADAYALSTAVYVGGGVRGGRVHSIAEAAIYGVPVAVGPGAADSPEGARFVEAAAVASLPRRRAADALAACWEGWMEDPPLRHRVGLAARGLMATGAAARGAAGITGCAGW